MGYLQSLFCTDTFNGLVLSKETSQGAIATAIGCGILLVKEITNFFGSKKRSLNELVKISNGGMDGSYTNPDIVNFRDYFIQRGILFIDTKPSVEQQIKIMHHFDLYSNQRFVEFIKTLPDYSDIIQKINHAVLCKEIIYPKNIFAFRAKAKFSKIIAQLAANAEKYKQQANSYSQFSKTLQECLDIRGQAYQAFVNGDITTLSKNYVVSKSDEATLLKLGYNVDRYRYCTGSRLNHALHEESLKILSALEQSYIVDAGLRQDIYAFNDTGLLCNHAGQTERAIMFTDLCWSLLDFAKYGFNGLVDGSQRAVTTIMNHPVATIFSITAARYAIKAFPRLAGPYGIALQLGIILGDIGFSYWQDPAKGVQKLQSYTARFSVVIDWLTNEQTKYGTKEVFGASVSIITEWAVDNKILSSLSNFFSRMKGQVLSFAKRRAPCADQILMTPEGIQIKIADSAISSNGINNRSIDIQGNNKNSISTGCSAKKYSNIEYIKAKRVPLDHETVLKQSDLFKYTGKIEQKGGAKVYKSLSNDRFYHRDTFHTGEGAHLEVYDARKNHLGIADPILGELIPDTAILGRKLRI
jgi:hypothetical protein